MDLPINYDESTSAKRRQARLQYVTDQEGLCCHCRAELSKGASEEVQNLKTNTKLFPIGFFKNPIHLHHDHNTGMTIGAVHAKCNAVLWEYHNE